MGFVDFKKVQDPTEFGSKNKKLDSEKACHKVFTVHCTVCTIGYMD